MIIDFDSDDEEVILDALETLYSMLSSKFYYITYKQIDGTVSIKDIIENNLSSYLVTFLSYYNADILLRLFDILIIIYQSATHDAVLFLTICNF